MYRVLYLAAIGIFLAAPVPSEAGGAPSASRLSRLRGHVGTEQRDIPQQQASVQVSGVANATAAEISPTGVGGLLRPRGQAIQPGEILSVDRCVGIGLANHPSIRAGSHAVDAAASRVGQARSGYYPQITLSSGYSKYSLVTDPMNTDVDQYSASATLTQSVYEFGKTWNRVTIQQRFRDAAQADLRDITNQVVISVKNAYYNVLRSSR